MEVDLSKAKESAHIVSRKTRLSVECHTSVLLDGLFDDDEDWDSLEGSEKCLGDIDVFLSALFFKSQWVNDEYSYLLLYVSHCPRYQI